jgi:hypothetical protein
MSTRKSRARRKSSPPQPGAQKEAPVRPAPPSRGKLVAALLAVAAAGVVGGVYVLADKSDPAPAAPAAPASGTIQFENRQAGSGVDFVLDNGTIGDKPVIDSTLGGVALFDYDNDGLLDIFFTNGAHIPSLKKSNASFHNRLYRNSGDRTFADVTKEAGLSGRGYNMGAAVGDYDNDGFADLYLSGVNLNTLYRNQGDGTFIDVTAKAAVAGLLSSGKKPWSVAATWVDYDADGRLDLFVVNYLDWSFKNNQICGDPGKRLSCSPALYQGFPNTLYRNNGDGTFEDVSFSTGIGAHIGKGMSAAIADYDDDGFIDIFVTNDSERNFLFHNVGGKSFEEMGVQAAVAFTEDGVPVSSMGLDFRDVTNDGRPDVTITALANETYPLFVNEGQGLFSDGTYAAEIGLASNTMSGWGNGTFDFDNDGWKDIFAANSHVSENVGQYRHLKYELANAVFQNRGNGTFADVTSQAGPGMQTPAAHRGAAFGDLDNDGRIDAVVSVIGGKPEILYNTSEPRQQWILIKAVGTKSNRGGIGTKIKLTAKSGSVQYNQVTTSVGYASSSDQRVHFGLGPEEGISEIELRWPSGTVQVLKDVEANQILEVREE